MYIEEVHIPEKVLEKAEQAEVRMRAEYVSFGERIKEFIRVVNYVKPQGGNYGEK
tara:strand:+ start:570 stop:734 length:165 start_codon:yes stop_codon:yes gene_type:complete